MLGYIAGFIKKKLCTEAVSMYFLERNMVGMFKQLDSWVKCVLPVLPYSTLQNSVLHLLQVSWVKCVLLVLPYSTLQDSVLHLLQVSWV